MVGMQLLHTRDTAVGADIGVGFLLDIVELEGFNHVRNLEFFEDEDNLNVNQYEVSKRLC